MAELCETTSLPKVPQDRIVTPLERQLYTGVMPIGSSRWNIRWASEYTLQPLAAV